MRRVVSATVANPGVGSTNISTTVSTIRVFWTSYRGCEYRDEEEVEEELLYANVAFCLLSVEYTYFVNNFFFGFSVSKTNI